MNMLMKHLVLVVGFTTMGTAVVGAQQTSAPPVTAEASANVIGPKIQFATMMHEFGRVRAGEPVKYTYVFTNTGDRLLILNTVQPQCGCTTAGEWTKQVESGKTGIIPIQFNTSAYNGPVFKQVTVTCNVTNQPTLFLQLKGTVYKAYEFIPSLAVLNIPPDAETASGVVTITNNTEEPLMLSAPESNNRAFTVELKTNALGKGYQLTISVVPPLPTANAQGQVSLRTSWTNPAVISVPVTANVQPAIVVIPPFITLAPGPLANSLTNSVAIQNKSTNDLQLSEPVVNVPGVEVQIKEMQPGKSFTALLAFPQGFQVPPGQQVELSIKSSNPKFPVVKVPIMQTPRPAPRPMAAVTPMKPVLSPAATPPSLPVAPGAPMNPVPPPAMVTPPSPPLPPPVSH
jgi:copper(I)-binding protein